MTLTPLTELEAVNRLLELIEEAPVNTLTNFEDDPDVGDAISHLRRACYDFQAAGWAFNKVAEHTLPVANDGAIYVPSNIASVEGYLILGNRKLQSLADRTTTFTSQVSAPVIFVYAFEELPAEVAAYVYALAVESFIDHKAPGTPLPSVIKQAWNAFHAFDVRTAGASLSVNTAISGRPRLGG